MKSQKLDQFKKRLLDERKEVLNTLKLMEDHQSTHASIRESTEELSSYDNHPADLGTEMFIVEMNANLENHERYRLTEIDRALEKIENGTYGNCNLCGKEIDEERLEFIPEANICMECAKDKMPIEDFQGDRGRPVEEELLYPAFERTNMDGKDYTGYDGEDAYQDVAKYNQVKNDPSFTTGDHLGVFDENSHGVVQEVENITEGEFLDQLYTNAVERQNRKRTLPPK